MGAALDDLRLDDVQDLLPASAQALVAALGLSDAREVIRNLHGTTVEIPKCRTHAGYACYEYLAERVGYSVAERLVKYFGGEALYVPRCEFALVEATYRAIRRDFDCATQSGGQSSGQAVRDLALRYGYSDRQIWSILKLSDRTELPRRSDKRQLALFGEAHVSA